MRMSNQMRDLRDKITIKRSELNEAISNNDVEKAKSAKLELENLDNLYNMAETAFENERKFRADPDDGENNNTRIKQMDNKSKLNYDANLFYKAITNKGNLSESEKSIISEARKKYNNSFSEGKKENGGYTVPDDLSKEIFESIKSQDSIRDLVDVEHVKSATGTRIVKSGTPNRLYNTEEYEELKELNNPVFSVVKYNQKKFAGLMPLSSELFEDSFINFQSEIVNWLSDSARVTENHQLLYGAGGDNHCQGILTTPGAYKEITAPSDITIEFLRKVKFSLKKGYRSTAKWIMNTDSLLAISEIKDGNGRSYMQPDPIKAEQYVLLGSPVYIFDDIETDEGKTVILYGDLKKAYRMFDRQNFGIAFTDVGAGAFETDSYKARGIERFDGKIMDNNALVIIRECTVETLTVKEPTAEFGAENKITEESLSYQNKNNLIALAEDLGVAGITTAMTKQAIITAIMSALNPTDDSEQI